MNKWLYWTLLLTILGYIQSDTKILREVNIFGDNSHRKETLSLKNENTPEEELVIEGTHTQDLFTEGNDFVYRIETIYVADKDGYKVKYKLVREPYVPIVLQLNPSTLKSVVG